MEDLTTGTDRQWPQGRTQGARRYSARKLVAAVTGGALLAAAAALPAVADDLVADTDFITAGGQTTVSASTTPGGSVDVPVDLYVTCKTQKHLSGNAAVTLAASSTVPAGGAMTSAGTTLVKPTGWPVDGTNCGNTPDTAPARATVHLVAPPTTGSYTYKAQWDVADADVTSKSNLADVTIQLTVTSPASDTTPPVITSTVTGTLGQNGWYTSTVTVTFGVTDAQSAVIIDAGCGIQNFTSETTAAAATCQAHSAGGSASSSVPLKIDLTGPTATQTASGTLGQNGWYTSDVVIHAAGTDPVSGGVTCTSDRTQTAETTGAAFTSSCTNAAGLSTGSASLTVKVDKTGPSAALAVTAGTTGTGGWYLTDVTVRATGADPISGGVTCTPDQTVSTNTSGSTLTGTCTNAAGLATAAAPLAVKLDKTDPDTQLAADGTLGTDSWYTSDVTLRATGSDDVSDPSSCDPDQQLTTDTPGQAFTASCTNSAGRTSSDTLTVKRDASPPTAHLEITGTAGQHDWYTSAVTVRTIGADPTSGVTCTADQELAGETVGTLVTGYCVNGAGLRTDAAPVELKVDLTPPTSVATVTGGTEGANGWYTSAVTVQTTGQDSVSGPVTCTDDQVVDTDTNGLDITGTCTNRAGLSTVSPPVHVKLDTVDPAVHLSAAGTLGLHGWYVDDVTVTTSGDDGSGHIVSCTTDQQQITETAGHTFHGSCTDESGRTGTAAPLTVQLDKTAPSVSVSPDRAPDHDPWYLTGVTVHTDGTDDVSGPAECSADQTVDTDTASLEVTGACTNQAGLTAHGSATVKVDTTNPSAAVTVSQGTLGLDGWYTSDVTLATHGSDNVSDPTSCTEDQVLDHDTAGETFYGSCTNSASLTQSAALSVKRDATPPTARLVVIGTEGAHGWYTSDVTVTVEGGDPTSGVTCVGGAHLTAETTGVEVTGSCTNGAGLVTDADPVTVKIDQTAPSAQTAVTTGTAGADGWYTSDVTVTTTGEDSISGPVTCTADQQQTDETTGHTFHGTCTNQAGLATDAANLDVKLDKTAPDVHLAVTDGTAGVHGWWTTAVTVHTAGTDLISGVTHCTTDQQQADETTGHTFLGHCTNGAGLTSDDQSLTVKVDTTAPTATQSPSGTQGDNGWYLDDVTITTTGVDDISAPVHCSTERTQHAETAGTTFDTSCTNDAGLRTDAIPFLVMLDRSAPSASLAVTGEPGSNGWFTGPVTATTTGADDISGPPVCTDEQVLDHDTAGTTVHGSCTNQAGLTGDADPVDVRVDLTNPTASLSVSHGSLGANGWYVDDVTVHTAGADNVSDPTACTPDQEQTSDTSDTGIDFHGQCTNDAGRTQDADSLNVRRDASPPTAHLSVVAGTPGTGGWYTTPVTVRTDGADLESGVTCSTDTVISADTAGTTVTGRCTNGAGLRTDATPLTVKLDTTAPTAQLSVTAGSPGAHGWWTSDVTVTTSGVDPTSSPVTCTGAQQQTIETTGTVFTGTCTNAAGLSTDAAPLTVKLDKSAPTALLTLVGVSGLAGWYVAPVTASTTGGDTISGPVTCTAPQAFTNDTTGTDVAGQCTNQAGLARQAPGSTFKLDQTPPTVAVTGLAPTYVIGATPTPGCNTTDATSGVATNASPTVPALTTIGTYTVTCAGATDRAGNTGASSATTRAIYGWDGFLQPVNDTAHQVDVETSVFKAGSTVPMKFVLHRADGTVPTPGAAPKWLTPVRGGPMTGLVGETPVTAAASTGDTYRADGQQWTYNWSTKGLAAGYWYRVGVTLDDGQTYLVTIGLR